MKNPRKNNVDASKELLNSVEEITPIYLDAHGEESRLRMLELAKELGIERQDDMLKIDFNSNCKDSESIADSGLLFLDPLGDPDVHRRIVELAQTHVCDQNL